MKKRCVSMPEACRQILAYLARNPDAGDTADGILLWWLTEQRLLEAKPEIVAALAWLVERNWILATRAEDSRWHYRLNRNRSCEMQQFLRGTKPV